MLISGHIFIMPQPRFKFKLCRLARAERRSAPCQLSDSCSFSVSPLLFTLFSRSVWSFLRRTVYFSSLQKSWSWSKLMQAEPFTNISFIKGHQENRTLLYNPTVIYCIYLHLYIKLHTDIHLPSAWKWNFLAMRQEFLLLCNNYANKINKNKINKNKT